MQAQALDMGKARAAAKAYAAALGHKTGRWDSYGACECERCGALLVDTDALAFIAESSVSYLGTLSAPCMGD
jgi:hypothetical protein